MHQTSTGIKCWIWPSNWLKSVLCLYISFSVMYMYIRLPMNIKLTLNLLTSNCFILSVLELINIMCASLFLIFMLTDDICHMPTNTFVDLRIKILSSKVLTTVNVSVIKCAFCCKVWSPLHDWLNTYRDEFWGVCVYVYFKPFMLSRAIKSIWMQHAATCCHGYSC